MFLPSPESPLCLLVLPSPESPVSLLVPVSTKFVSSLMLLPRFPLPPPFSKPPSLLALPPMVPSGSSAPPLCSPLCDVDEPQIFLSLSLSWGINPMAPPQFSKPWTPHLQNLSLLTLHHLIGFMLPRIHRVLSVLRFHWAPLSLRLHLCQSLTCLHHGLPLLWLHLIPPSLSLCQASPYLQLLIGPHSLHLHPVCQVPISTMVP